MKNLRFLCLLFFCLTVISIVGIRFGSKPKQQTNAPGIVTSFYPMYIAALNLLHDVDTVSLSNLSEPQTGCLHDYTLTTGDMKELTQASALIVNGGGIEPFLNETKAFCPHLYIIDAGKKLKGLPSYAHEHEDTDVHDEHDTDVLGNEHEDTDIHDDEHDTDVLGSEHEDTDVHDDEHDAAHTHEDESDVSHEHEPDTHHHHDSGQNAHYWMSIPRYKKQINAIRDGLCTLLSNDHTAVEKIMTNAAAYSKKLTALQKEQKSIKKALAGKKVILFHEAFAYVADDYGLDVASVMDLDEERQVSAGEVADVIHIIKNENVSFILAEETYGREMGELVSSQTNIPVIYLDTIVRGQGREDADAYLMRMHQNILLLKQYTKTE